MGVEARTPSLPAPTDSDIFNDSPGENETDFATDISRMTDKSSHTIPDDGRPITISTRGKKEYGKLTKSSHQSQTSLLIEYFEGGKGSQVNPRPSVRVKVTPSSARKIRESNERIEISETGGRRPSYTRRISLGGRGDKSLEESLSSAEDSNLSARPPLEIEVSRKEGSDLSGTSQDPRYVPISSDISSMPADSMLSGSQPRATPQRQRSRSLSRDEMTKGKDTLKAPTRQRSRSLSRERIARKAMEKLGAKPGEGKSRSTYYDGIRSPKRRSNRTHEDEDYASGVDSSVMSASQVSSKSGYKYADQYSHRSAASKTSISSNPKLLETVEDAIRRLILPELRDIKKENSTGRRRHNRYDKDSASVSSISQEDTSRSRKPKVVLNRDGDDPGVVLSGNSVKDRRRSNGESSPSGNSEYGREASNETTIREEKAARRRHRRDGSRVAAGAAGGLIGSVLTKEALKHHESRSSIDSKERGKSHSRNGSRSSLADDTTEKIFQKHDVAPMPMRSEIDSELTRTSILSEQTAPPSGRITPVRTVEMQEVTRGSPREMRSPVSGRGTPPKSPLSIRSLGTHHGNLSQSNLSLHSTEEDEHIKPTEFSPLQVHPLFERNDRFLNRAPRALSPIQSVASYQEGTEEPYDVTDKRDVHSMGSISSIEKPLDMSISTMSSAATTDMARSHRAPGVNPEKTEDIPQHDMPESDLTFDGQMDNYNKRGYRNSLEASYLQTVAGQEVRGIELSPEYMSTPVAVESAVASLHNPSALDGQFSELSRKSVSPQSEKSYGYPDSPLEGHGGRSSRQSARMSDRGSPLKQRHDVNAQSPERSLHEEASHDHIMENSPRQSIARSIEEKPVLGASGLPVADDPIPEIGHGLDDESEINTNPSIIHGPIGQQDSRDHWPYSPTSPGTNDFAASKGEQPSALQAAEAGVLGAIAGAGLGAAASRDLDQFSDRGLKENRPLHPSVEDYQQDGLHNYGPATDSYGKLMPTSPRDEGYMSAANPRSPGAATPEYKPRGLGVIDDADLGEAFGDGGIAGDDPFVGKHVRHLSGYSQGMSSPLYDSAMGKGLDRIQSKDIVALMDHLTVRDAQRNARDTEILVTLVRSAAEMRNSFEDMKKFITEQDDFVMDNTDRQFERTTQKILQGPRPQPGRLPRSISGEEGTIEEASMKKKSIFKRALQGLSSKSSNDLGRIEDMLVQLLGEVEDLKSSQKDANINIRTASNSLRSSATDNMRERRSIQDGYEPEGQAGTSSTGNQSGFLSNSSRPAVEQQSYTGRRGSQNRISTVMEGDEDLSEHEEHILNNQFEKNEQLLSPTSDRPRAGSEPLATPPHPLQPAAPLSSDNTPKTSTEKSRKHKSSSSSFFPKFSRWSKTTTSSVPDNIKGSGKNNPYSEASRSGSDLQIYNNEYYDAQGDDRLRSKVSLPRDEGDDDGDDRPPSPLIPSVVSDQPKYQAHRNSLNLQHPQPRPGPTHRHQYNLEFQAQDYDSPISRSSMPWDSNSNLPSQFTNSSGAGNRNSYGAAATGRLSPISDGRSSRASSRHSAAPPPRPPKIRDDIDPLIPQRPPKVTVRGGQPSYADHIAARSGPSATYNNPNGSPTSSGIAPGPQRRPTGPRPITSSGNWSPDRIAQMKKNRYRGSPTPVDSQEDMTF
ncbi:MAG: hypothetical protein M1834_001387 [Cirrosporium novae-zelandiae]|nr:MAG: hypothetical protein M1834_001387 [Cirrosporium novae-zelandiae]